jgi:hypothetical protein
MFSASFLLLYLVSVVLGSTYILTQTDKDQLLDYHNQIRANYNLPPLQWDPSLENSASNYAVGCVFKHSQAPGLGENLAYYSKSATSSFPLTSWMSQVNGWYDESKYWNCMTGSCSSICGHLTQIVSLVTTAVGCGVANCDPGTISTTMRAQYLVCQYSPQGNVNLGSKHPVSGQPYPYNGCPASNPSLVDQRAPVAPVTPKAPLAPLGNIIPTAPTAPVTPVMPTGTVTPVSPVPTQPIYIDPNAPWTGCKGDYWPGSPPKQKITPCNAAPRTFTTAKGKRLYCDVKDPTGYFWPVLNPGTPECNFVARLEEDAAASSGGLPYYYWIGIALGVLVLLIIVIVIIVLVVKKKSADERV